MSYEFRTPLTSIGGFAELIKSGAAGPVSKQMDEYVSAILESVEKLREQVENVLDLSQSEAGLLPMSKEKFAILPFVTALVREREQALRSGGVALDLRGAAGQLVEGDPRQLGRHLGHLIDNALRTTGKAGRVMDTERRR